MPLTKEEAEQGIAAVELEALKSFSWKLTTEIATYAVHLDRARAELRPELQRELEGRITKLAQCDAAIARRTGERPKGGLDPIARMFEMTE